MNRTIKFVGLLAILPLALVAISPILIGDANATNVGSQDIIGRPGYQPDKVCGDRLCSGENGPNVGTQNGIGRPGYQPDKVCGDRLCLDSASANLAKYAQRLASESTNSTEYDALITKLVEKTQELSIANVNSDSEKVSELQGKIKDLRNQISEWKNN